MSQVSEAANVAVQWDWKLIAAALATFLATFTISILGWFQGRKKMEKRMTDATGDGGVTSAILLDNQTIREATVVNREVRDRLLVHCEALTTNTKSIDQHTTALDDILEELRLIRKGVDKLPTRP